MEVDTAPRPWDKLPEENTRWYQRFLIFLWMGPERSLVGAQNILLKSKDKTQKERSASTWDTACLRFRWRDRALQYDNAQRAIAEQEALALHKREQEDILRERKLLRQKELRMAERLRVKADGLLDLPIEREIITDKGEIVIGNHPAFRTAAGLVKQFSETARTALGMPAMRTQIDISKLSTEDLLTLYEQLTAEEPADAPPKPELEEKND